jgi:ubiquinone biosynthesis protein
MHQGNLFVRPDGTIVAIDFGIMGRIDRRARQWLAEILYGLTTANYRRVAEIHFEAQYVPSYHSVDEFATALRAVGEPMRGKPVSELSVGHDARRAVRDHPRLRHADPAAPAAAAEDHGHGRGHRHDAPPEINMWDVSAPYVRSWIRDELGPEAALADRLREDFGTLLRLPALIRRIEDRYPPRGGAPEQPPLPEVDLVWERKRQSNHWVGYVLAALAGGTLAWAVLHLGLVN